ncbi:unnamed protein product [Pelagomonas calceolata]|uniref:Uncharacterized protein n=1 Tax=Pelagomonas calceolata TaxID=35677 RepID=A0A8J2SG02_9STRA|nr:unnamed protein product [Pelagomonas calceolata]
MWRASLALAAVAAVVAASPPACRAGLGSFQVNISEVTRLRRRDDARRRRLDGVNHTHAVNHTTHKERVAQHRREWKLRKKSKHAAAEQARAENATCYAKNYADLEYHYCKKGCNVGALLDHFRDHGRGEGRSFGCVNISAAEKAKYGQVACPTDHHVGGCDDRLNVGRQGSRGVTCRPVGGNCACGRPADLDAAAARAGATHAQNATRICAYVRSYDGHKSVIGTMLQTMRAAARAAGTPVDLEVHLANTDRRLPLSPCFRRRVAFEASCVDQNASGSFEIHERFDDRYQRAEAAFRRRWGVKIKVFGYILTDLWLLEMRRRGGCDFIHVTNGDNIYHVDFFRHQLAVFNARPDVGSTAVDFFCHLLKRFQRVAFRIAAIDLGCMLVRPSAMRNVTFAVGLFEDGKPQPSQGRLHAADGFFAAELARRAPAVPIHDHGPLFFHF